jgi:hypothetical protein
VTEPADTRPADPAPPVSGIGLQAGHGAPSPINRVVRSALDQPLLVGLLVVALIATGVWSFGRLPVDAYPDLSPPIVDVIT